MLWGYISPVVYFRGGKTMKFNKVYVVCFALLAGAIALNVLAQKMWTLPGFEQSSAVIAVR